MSSTDIEPAESRRPARYHAKREAILAAAALAINEQSAKGLTLADVGRRVGLTTTSVTYYFKKKEDLAAACFSRTLDKLLEILDQALEEPTPQLRVRRYLSLHMARLARIQAGQEAPFAVLSDLRAMEDPLRGQLLAGWRTVFRRTRSLWGAPATRVHADLYGARAHLLLEKTFWLPVWLDRYDAYEFDRLEARMMQLLTHGVAAEGQSWAPELIPLVQIQDDETVNRDAFLRVATRLMNEVGYRGASVERISAELKVTKGSFYHHMDAKDDLITACYDRSFNIMTTAQRLSDTVAGNHWRRLSSVLASILDLQLANGEGLLRTTALTSVPAHEFALMLERSHRIAQSYAGMISDGVAEGSMRPVDPFIASQGLVALQNAAFDMRSWASTMPRERAVALYASSLAFGMFDDGVLEAL